jgi:molecular chaperone DnaK
MSKIIGIDLGTTNSVVAVMEGDQPVVIVNEEGARTTPSVVGFGKDGERMVGIVARRQAITNAKNTVYSAKRLIGRRFDEAESILGRLPYEVAKTSNGGCRIKVDDQDFSPPEISAMVLQKLKAQAEAYLGQSVTEAVITVPAYFNDSQRQATKDAGRIAGLEVKRIINEPTAAALAYGMNKQNDEVIAVYDFGGGTFDISILEVGDDVVDVQATNGDTNLGGDDVDEVLIDWLVAEFKKDTGIDLSSQQIVLQRLKDAAEKAKIELSTAQSSEINLPFLTADASGPKHLQKTLKRSEFERMIEPIIERTLGPCRQALKDADVKPNDVNEVILVGGSTRIPLVRQKVEQLFGKSPNRSVNPDEVVGLGAAIQGGVLSGDVTSMLLLDVTPLSLGIETLGGVNTILISRNTTIPHSKQETFSTAADNQTAVDIYVFQGERQMARDNRLIGNFRLDGLPPAPRGVPQVEVSFDIDANGILSVTAKDKASGTEQSITIEASSGLSESEIDTLVEEGKQHEEDDKQRRDVIEQRNKLDSLVYQVEKMVTENGETLPSEEKETIEGKLQEAKDALDSDDEETLKSAFEGLSTASHKLAEMMYQSQQPSEGDPAQEPSDDDGDVIDADFEEA